jgi:hypothetical protein
MRSVILVLLGGMMAMVGPVVRGLEAGERSPVTFERDVQPILTRAGCNAGACHGKSRGQNGFALSLLGFDPAHDYEAIAKDAGGRRVSRLVPADSLLLAKATARLPHGGGVRLEPRTSPYETILRWVAAGMPRTPADAPRVQQIAVEPTERTLKPSESFPMRVTAHFTDGSAEDVTALAAFASSEPALVKVDAEGRVTAGPIPGDATVSARFVGLFANCDVNIPMAGAVPAARYRELPRSNFIDDLVWTKLRKLGLLPSAPADDATYLRRAYLDVIGRLPTSDEARAFLSDTSAGKRPRLVARLLDRPEYADHWANKWVDLLRPNPYRVGIKAVLNLDSWIRDAFRRNLPYDQFVYEIVTARGSTFEQGPATIFRDRREPEEIAPMVSQLFLGIRLECAKCHHHPFESWDQAQFYEFAAYFARIGRKGTGLSPPISGSEEIMYTSKSGSVKHPLTGQVLAPRALFGSAPVSDDPDSDPREALARWMTAPTNPYFTKVIVNRVWAEIMGRGIVDPVDDLRATNPPSNGPLLDALADDFRRHGYDLKHLIGTILSSSVYALSSEPTERNVADTRNFSRHYRQRLRAEVLLDAISDVTGVPDTFAASPPGSRASEIWTHRVPSLFLDTFGRPDPNQDPPCERTSDTTVVQALHLMNAPNLHRKITGDGSRAALLASSTKSPREIVDELYAVIYTRLPDEEERRICLKVFEKPGRTRRQAIEDLMWAMINTAEFVFKD